MEDSQISLQEKVNMSNSTEQRQYQRYPQRCLYISQSYSYEKVLENFSLSYGNEKSCRTLFN